MSFPVRGAPGGWRGTWHTLDAHAELRVRVDAAERELERFAEREALYWQEEIAEKRQLTRNWAAA